MNAKGESDPNAVFIRVYSCPFAVEICSYSTSPDRNHHLLSPQALKIGKTTNGHE
jgi:hypothetical protein